MKKYILALMVIIISSIANNLFSQENYEYIISVTHGSSYVGDIRIQLYPEVAPLHCRNFDSLVSIGFYNGTAFHRVIPDFMIQGGDPNSKGEDRNTWGFGDPGQTTVPAEFSELKHLRGTLAAARKSGNVNSATSQFFICVVPCPWLDGQYTIYGEVTAGMDIVDYIVLCESDDRDNPLDKVEMTIAKSGTSVEEEFNNSFVAITPNPASDYIEVALNEFHKANPVFQNGDIELFDVLGRRHSLNHPSLTLPAGEEVTVRLDVSHLHPGIYFVRVGDEFLRFVKM